MAEDQQDEQPTSSTKRRSQRRTLYHRMVFPGESYSVKEVTGRKQKVRVGAGLTCLDESGIHITKSGVIQFDKRQMTADESRPELVSKSFRGKGGGSRKSRGYSGGRSLRVSVSHLQRRYLPRKEDRVLGTVVGKSGPMFYKVEIGAPRMAAMHVLDFEGATKRNRPQLKPGDLIYARVNSVSKDVSPQLSCKHPVIHTSWVVRGKAVFGPLTEGMMVDVSCSWADRLLDHRTPHLYFLGKLVPFECCVANNGRLWMRAQSAEQTIVLCNALRNGEHLNYTRFKAMVHALFNRYLGREYQLTAEQLIEMDED